MNLTAPASLTAFLILFGTVAFAAWKWENLPLRALPFLVATLTPILLGWDNILYGIIVINLATAGLLIGLLLGGRRNSFSNTGKKE